uniref:hypothetical protein n=2 Tax=Gelidibacter sp. TaxID=2018083 RepID=UPI004049F2C3
MTNHYIGILLLVFSWNTYSQTTVKDKQTQQGVSFATISFGNGHGIFADDEGLFVFTKKLYPDVDSLFVSALGYEDFKIATINLPETIHLNQKIDALDEIIITAKIDRKFKEEKMKPYLDDDYYKCWLPTIESEIAVFFKSTDEQIKKISKVHFPITLESSDWDKRKRSNADKREFSTLFKVKFYSNNNGFPGKELTYETIVFIATEKDGDVHNLDVSNYDIFVPKSGFFVSLQVMGYTDEKGKLLPNKKYKEVKTGTGVVKIPTNFRPLLPFTDKIPENNTFIKSVFSNNNQWLLFDKGTTFQPSLIKSGLTNYGVGVTYNIYKDE